MKTFLKRCLLLSWLALSAVAGAQTPADDLKPFPLPDSGRQRVVIRLPAVSSPEGLRVEVMVGKTVPVDCNHQHFITQVTRETAQGWGYSYYSVDELRGPATTLMACPPGTPKHLEFVRAPAEVLDWLEYNAKLPIVIYLPVGAEARYRIWSVGSQVLSATAE
jgi:ecotin